MQTGRPTADTSSIQGNNANYLGTVLHMNLTAGLSTAGLNTIRWNKLKHIRSLGEMMVVLTILALHLDVMLS